MNNQLEVIEAFHNVVNASNSFITFFQNMDTFNRQNVKN